MTDIQKISTELTVFSQETTPSVTEIIRALESTIVSQSLPHEIVTAVQNGVKKSFQDTGFNIQGSEEEREQAMIYLIREVSTYIKNRHHGVRLAEIPIAFSRGIRKLYGDYMGLSVISFCNFIDGYVKDQDRIKALQEKSKLKLEEPKIPEYNEMFTTAKENAIKAFNEVKVGKEPGLSAGVVHDFLETIGLIDLDDEEIKSYQLEAKQKVLAEYVNKVELDKFKRIDNKLIIDALTSGTDQKRVKHLIVFRAKTLVLQSYFQTLMMEDGNLEELIEEKRAINDK